jgi:D-3-phosphoglycerate dehydrogenase
MPAENNRRPVIAITDASYFAPGFIEEKMPRLLELGEVKMVDPKTEMEIIEALSGVDAAVVRRVKMTQKVFASCPRLLGIAKMGAGVENIDIPAATDNRVIVANSPAVTIAVAEAALLLMMAVTKPFLIMVESANNGQQPPPEARGTELYGKTLGIVGFGAIGSHLGKIAKGIGMTLLVHDPYVPKSPGFEFVDLPELLRNSDFVSLHCPLNQDTHHLIGAEELALMKPSAVLINTSRGGVVDEQALITTLRQGGLRGAGLDVVENEPIAADNPLLKMSNVIVTPHALARTWESITKVGLIIQDVIQEIIAGGMPETALNPHVERKPSPFVESITGV